MKNWNALRSHMCKVLAGLFFWLCTACSPAQAERVSRLVVPFPPGGSLDQVARMLVPALSAGTGQTFIVENRPGADGALAADYVLRHTGEERLLLLGSSYLTTGQVQGSFKFDVLTAFKPVIQLGEFEILMVAKANGRVTDLSSLLNRLGQGGQTFSCAAPPGQLVQACELLDSAFPNQWLVVPFKGEAQALQALRGGHVDVMFSTRTAAFELIQTGRLRLIGSASARAALPPFESAPRLGVAVPGLELLAYIGVFAAASSIENEELVRLNQIINDSLRSGSFLQFMHNAHIRPVGGSPKVMQETFLQSVERQKKWPLPKAR